MRFRGFDILRVLCTFAVVWIHGCDTSSLAKRLTGMMGFAVPVFILMSFFLLQRSVLAAEALTPTKLLWKRMKRLLPAYLVWSCAYLVMRSLKHAVAGDSLGWGEWGIAFLTGGASYQLYFVAAVVYWQFFFVFLLLWRSKSSWVPTLALFLISLLCFVAGAAAQSGIGPEPNRFIWSQMLGLTGYVPLAMGVARLWGLCHQPMQNSAVQRGLALCLSLAGVAWLAYGFSPGKGLIASCLLLVGGLLFSCKNFPPGVARLSHLSYGIFLVHGFFVEGFQMILPKLGLDLTCFGSTFFLIVLSFACSYFVCEVLVRIRKIQWLVV